MLLSAFLPSTALADSIQVSGNGALSQNDVSVSSNQTSSTMQSNYTSSTNVVNTNANTGSNQENNNTGGSNSTNTGGIYSAVTLTNTAGNNVIASTPSGPMNNLNTNIGVNGNGFASSNSVGVQMNSSTQQDQLNVTQQYNKVAANLNTGNNTTSDNTGGSSWFWNIGNSGSNGTQSGPISSTVMITNTAGNNFLGH